MCFVLHSESGAFPVTLTFDLSSEKNNPLPNVFFTKTWLGAKYLKLKNASP